jgi:predicted GH43/DUF377 family glycosyl hydrolase
MDLAERFPGNPLLSPGDLKPSREGWVVECLLNPGAFRFGGKTCLLMRVAERPVQEEGWVSTPVRSAGEPGRVGILRFRKDDPKLALNDTRVFSYDGAMYLTTLSHLRLATSADGVRFTCDEKPLVEGTGPLETFGVEDCRVARVGDEYHLAYTAVSADGHGVALQTTRDWKRFEHRGMILPPPNKDCALFEERIGGNCACLHRPSPSGLGGPFVWYADSPDLVHWGNHRLVARPRPGLWDSVRIGPGSAPIRTGRGWLALYHGVDAKGRYALGAMLLDLAEPWKVLARSREPFLAPEMDYERKGFYGEVVFSNGHIVDGDTIIVYYGASDTVICGCTAGIKDILDSLR